MWQLRDRPSFISQISSYLLLKEIKLISTSQADTSVTPLDMWRFALVVLLTFSLGKSNIIIITSYIK